MEKLISNLSLQYNDLIFLSGLLLISIITIVLFILTRVRSEILEEPAPEIDPTESKAAGIGESFTLTSKPEIKEALEHELDLISPAKQSTTSETPSEVKKYTQGNSEFLSVETKTGEITESTKIPETVRTTVLETPERVEESQQILEKDIKEDNFFSRLRFGLSKTHTGLIGKLDLILKGKEISDDIWDEFEEILVTSDLGVTTAMKLREEIEKKMEKGSPTDPVEIKNSLKSTILEILKNAQGNVKTVEKKPFVIMVAGVNGVGKTTTIGKLAHKFKEEGMKVMVAAADTFRAAAIDQLEVWSNRVGSEFIRGQMGSDPSAVAFDAVKAAISREIDILIIDTAGRLHTRANLMEELKKLRKVIGRELEGAPHETILVLDATTGQNAVQQAKLFDDALELTGIALTKLDGTAKGGVIVSIANDLNIPVKYIGIGESLKDLRDFDAEEFVEALFYSGSETIH